MVGPQGPRGEKGDAGENGTDADHLRNWKQCAWKSVDDRDIGLVKVRYAGVNFKAKGERGFYVTLVTVRSP